MSIFEAEVITRRAETAWDHERMLTITRADGQVHARAELPSAPAARRRTSDRDHQAVLARARVAALIAEPDRQPVGPRVRAGVGT